MKFKKVVRDLVKGEVFSNLTVVSGEEVFDESTKNPRLLFLCRCGNTNWRDKYKVLLGKTTDCGRKCMLRAASDPQVGQKIGKWTILEGMKRKNGDSGFRIFECRCDCGTVRWHGNSTLGQIDRPRGCMRCWGNTLIQRSKLQHDK